MVRRQLIGFVLSLIVALVSCSEEGYETVAKIIEMSMDASADPCTDFYQYSCGNWRKNHTRDVLNTLNIEVLTDLTDALNQIDMSNHNSSFAIKQAKIYYDLCVHPNPDQPRKDLRQLRELLDQYGGWPVVDYDWRPTSLGMAGLMGRLAGQLGVDAVFSVGVQPDWLHPKHQNLQLDARPVVIVVDSQGNAGWQVYASVVAEAAQRLGGDNVNTKRLRWDAIEIAQIEMTINQKTLEALGGVAGDNKPGRIPEGTHNEFMVTDAVQRWPNMNWAMFLYELAKGNTDLEHMFAYPMIIQYPGFFDWFNQYVRTIDERTWANYLVWKLIEVEMAELASFRDLSSKLREAFRDAHSLTTQVPPTNQTLCARNVVSNLPNIAGRVYINYRPVSKEQIKELRTMIDLVLEAWRSMIAGVQWMSEKSKRAAFSKIDNVAGNVAYPEWIMNNTLLDEYYAELNISLHDDPFTVANKALRFKTWKALRTIGQDEDRHEWLDSPALVNAWYAPSYNSITFPAAIMRPPVFSTDFPRAYTYAALGTVMGHELGHAFDSSGVYWDGVGKYEKDTWMDPKSKAAFETMAKCVVNEYDKFCFPEIKKCIEGDKTLGENIGDNGGVRAAYRAYHNWVKTRLPGGELPIPGKLNKMSSEKLFFMSYGHLWCANPNKASIANQLQIDVHSPDMFRVIGVLRNMPEFAQTFNCPADSKMAPSQHCNVWI